jgi:hypothetical protein
VNETANVVADDFAEHFIDHRDWRLAAIEPLGGRLQRTTI